MADTKISGLPAVTAFSSALSEELPVVQSGASKKTTVAQLRNTIFAVTCLWGNTLYLWPAALGPYASVQAAVNAVPDGGEVVLMADLDLNTYNSNNPLLISSAIHLRGAGAGWGGNNVDAYTGPKISTQSGATHTVEWYEAATGRLDNSKVSNLYIEHRGSGAGLYIKGTTKMDVERVCVHCRSTGAYGIHVASGSPNTFWIHFKRILVRYFTTMAILDEGAGSQNFYEDISINDNWTGGTPTCSIKFVGGGDKHILSGEISATGGSANSKTGIILEPAAGADATGFTISNFLFEDASMGYCITIGNSSGDIIRASQFRNIMAQTNKGMTVFRFLGAEDNIAQMTSYAGGTGADITLAEFNALSRRNRVEVMQSYHAAQASPSTFQRPAVIENGGGNHQNTIVFKTPINEMDMLAANAMLPLNVDALAECASMTNCLNGGALVRAGGKWKGPNNGDFLRPDDVVSANCLLWLEADRKCYSDAGSTACTDGDPVQEWHDVDATRASTNQFTNSGGNRPTWVEDVEGRGHPGLLFDSGSSQSLAGVALALGGKTCTIVACATPDLTGTYSTKHVISRLNTSDAIYFNATSDVMNCTFRVTSETGGTPNTSTLNNFLVANYIGTTNPDGASPATHTCFSLVGRYDGDRSPAQVNLCNGDQATTTDATDVFKATAEVAAWYVGQSGNSSGYFDGWIHGVAIFDGYLSDKEAYEIMMYFANKYHAVNAAAS